VEFRLWRGVPHCWQFLGSMLPEAEESLRLATEFVMKHTRI
jgi:hypothetical protein